MTKVLRERQDHELNYKSPKNWRLLRGQQMIAAKRRKETQKNNELLHSVEEN